MDYYHLKNYINTTIFFEEYNDYHNSRYDHDTEYTTVTAFPQLDDEYCFRILCKIFSANSHNEHLKGFVSNSHENKTGLFRGNYVNINIDSSHLKLNLFDDFLPFYDTHEHCALLKTKNEYQRQSSRTKYRNAFKTDYQIDYALSKKYFLPFYSRQKGTEIDLYKVSLTKTANSAVEEYELSVLNNNPRLSLDYSFKIYLYCHFMSILNYSIPQ